MKKQRIGLRALWGTTLLALVAYFFSSAPEVYSQTGCPPSGSTSPHVVGKWDENLIGPFFPYRKCDGGANDGDWCLSDSECGTGITCKMQTVRTPFPMHAILLKTGKVLILPIEGRLGMEDAEFFTAMLFDPTENTTAWTDADFNKREFQVPQSIPNVRPAHLVPCSGHAALPDGRIVFVGGEGGYPEAALTTILDPDRLTIDANGVHCNDCWIVQDQIPEIPNEDNVCTLDPAGKLRNRRYYPTVTAMADGRFLVMGGASDGNTCQLKDAEGANTPMIFDPSKPNGQQWSWRKEGRGCLGPGLAGSSCGSGTCGDSIPRYASDWSQQTNSTCTAYGVPFACCTGNQDGNCGPDHTPNRFHIHYYPHMFQLTDATFYMAGSLAGPYWDTVDPLTSQGPKTGKFSIAGDGSWSNLITDGHMSHKGATVMYAPNKLLKSGGALRSNHVNVGDRTVDPTNKAFTIDLNGSSPQWEATSFTEWDRRGVNLIVLPDGKVAAMTGTTGSLSNRVNINCPEIWDSRTGDWSVMAKMAEPYFGTEANCTPNVNCDDFQKGNRNVRGDHSEALLLPDARVLVLGGEYNAESGPGNQSAQIFSPPYLFGSSGPATRPVIASVERMGLPTDVIRPGENFRVYVEENSHFDDIDTASLIRLGATTHGFDQEQRFIPLQIQFHEASGNDYIDVQAVQTYDGPPGYYMLFILDEGVPSVARIIRLSDCSIDAPLPEPSGVQKNRFISFSVGAGVGEVAIRVTLESLHLVNPPYSGGASIPFTAFNREIRWVGAPITEVESNASGTQFKAAMLQCTPHYRDWGTGLLHVYGSGVVPSSTYQVSTVDDACVGNEATCNKISCPLEIKTSRWGDINNDYGGADLGDVGSLINKFRDASGAPIKARSVIVPINTFGEIDVAGDVNFTQISACVDAFRGAAYPGIIEACP